MLHRVSLHIRVSPETRQRLQLLRTQRHLNVGSRLRALIDEALDREFGRVPTDANELAAPVKAAPPEPIPGWTPARLMLNEVAPKAQHFIENRSCHGPKALRCDPIRLYLLASNPR